MVKDLKMYIDNTRLTEKERAIKLHENILLHANAAAEHFVSFCKSLKHMKDTDLYKQLGYGEFEEYTEGALGIKQRQAYYYISVLDSLGEDYVSQHPGLGVSKLALLASASPAEREELEQHDLESESVRELQEALELLRKKTEQLDIFTAENAELKSQIEEAKNRGVDYDSSEDSLARLEDQNAQIAAAKREAADAATAAARAEVKAELDKLTEEKEKVETERKEAEKRAKDAEKKVTDAEKEKAAVKAEKDKIAKELEIEKKRIKIDPEIHAALETEKAKREQLEKQLKVSADPEMTKFAFLLENFKAQGERVLAYMAEAAQKHEADDDAIICKMRKATAALLDAIKAKV